MTDLKDQLAQREAAVRERRSALDEAISRRNEIIESMRSAGSSYGDIAKVMGITRAGVMGICRKIEAQKRGLAEMAEGLNKRGIKD